MFTVRDLLVTGTYTEIPASLLNLGSNMIYVQVYQATIGKQINLNYFFFSVQIYGQVLYWHSQKEDTKQKTDLPTGFSATPVVEKFI